MSNATNKTKPTKHSVQSHLNAIGNPDQRREAKELCAIFQAVTGWKPVLWGEMIGFGQYHYKYDSGREGDYFATGFAMRKSGPTIYIMPGYKDYSDLLHKLGPHKLGKSCLYIKRLNDIDTAILKRLIRQGLADLKQHYSVTGT